MSSRFGALLLALLVILVAAPGARASLYDDFTVHVDCVAEAGPGVYRATFHWVNAQDTASTPYNRVVIGGVNPDESAGTPPSTFAANSEGDWTTEPVDKATRVEWILNGARATSRWQTSPRCGGLPQVVSTPEIVGDWTVGGELHAVGAQFKAAYATQTLRYSWIVGCEQGTPVRSVQTDVPRFVPAAGDVGHAIRLVVVLRELNAGSQSATGSCDGSRVVGRAPSSTEVPRVAGTPVVGGPMSLAGGAWDASPQITQTVVRWQTCDAVSCLDVATTSADDAYRPVAADVGRTVRALVTASNPVGSLLVATPQSAPVAPAPASGSGLIAPATVDFGGVAEGAGATQTVTYTNDGGAPVIVRTGIEGVHAGDFAATANSCRMATLQPGEACAVELRFAPNHTGARTADLRFDDGERSVVPLRGTGVAGPVAQLGRDAVRFGPVPVGGRSAKQAITVTNAGSAPLLVTEVVRTGVQRSDFSLATTCDPAEPIAPGDGCQVTTTFFPRATGARTATLQVRSNAAGGAQLVDLVGEGTG